MVPLPVKRRKLRHESSDDGDSQKANMPSIIQRDEPDKSLHSNTDGDTRRKQQPSYTPHKTDQTSEVSGFLGEANKPSLFKLQIDELLEEVRPDYEKRLKKAEAALRNIKSIIDSLPDREPISATEADLSFRKTHNVAIPFAEPRPGNDVNYYLKYTKPANINVVGSYALRSTAKAGGNITIDLAVTLPSDLLEEKDYLNYRYFHKRAYYLACIVVGIQEAKNCTFQTSFALQNGNTLQPIVVVGFLEGKGEDDFTQSKCEIRIIAAAPENIFPKAKTLPNKNCIRTQKKGSPQAGSNGHAPTPFYNASVRAESSLSAYLKFLHSSSLQCDGYTNACILGRLWLRQRGLGTDLMSGGFGHFEWAALMAILLRGGGSKGKAVLSSGYSSYQLFKATLKYLVTSDLTQSPLFFQCESSCHFTSQIPMIFDGPRSLNILFKMTQWSYDMLRQEASTTLSMLNEPLFDHFEATFLSRVDARLWRFDSIIRIHVPSSNSPSGGSRILESCQIVFQALRKGLGDRISLMHLMPPMIHPWQTTRDQEVMNGQIVLVGLQLSPEQVGRAVDHGPPAEDKAAAASFRKFWGEKAELRRFKDGSILESLIWSDNEDGTSILKQIIEYVIHRHLGPEAANGLVLTGDTFDHILSPSAVPKSHNLAYFQPLMTAYETLERQIREIEGMPLQIRQISPASPQLRYATANPPATSTDWFTAQPADCYIQFEGSNRWPDHIGAIQTSKIAFLLKMGELLERSVDRLVAKLGLENVKHTMMNAPFLDILHPTGFAFRLRIHADREQSLLEQRLKDKALTPSAREETAFAMSAFKRSFLHAPSHTQAVRTLCTRYTLLSPCIRLFKKWCNGHLLSFHFSEELLELLVLQAFVHPYPWPTPGSVMTGFLRTLSFIARWDWRTEPLILNLNGELTAKDVDAIDLRFRAWRKIDPGLNRVVMFVASNLDHEGITWTERGPSKVVAARLTGLAKAAIGVVKEQDLDVDASALFMSSLKDYDFLIRLDEKFVGNGAQSRSKKLHQQQLPKYKNLQVQVTVDTGSVGFNPAVLFLQELQSLYGHAMLFFYNGDGGSVIGGLWSPHTASRSWKVNMTYSTVPKPRAKGEEEDQIGINKEAILNEIAKLGGDMVTSIETSH